MMLKNSSQLTNIINSNGAANNEITAFLSIIADYCSFVAVFMYKRGDKAEKSHMPGAK